MTRPSHADGNLNLVLNGVCDDESTKNGGVWPSLTDRAVGSVDARNTNLTGRPDLIYTPAIFLV